MLKYRLFCSIACFMNDGQNCHLCVTFQNEGIPETDEGPTVEVVQPLSREGTPTGEQDAVDTDTKKEEPDAAATPPPPESQSPEPTTELEPLDTFIESGDLTCTTQLNWLID